MDTTALQPQSTLFQRGATWLPILAIISLVLLLWLPFGWRIGFYTDEWTTMRDIQAGNLITGSVRPFEVVSWYIAYHMSPDNLYIGINVLVMLLIMGKGILSYLLLSDMHFNKLFAFGTAALLVLYPADMGTFYLGALSIHSSIFTYLLAVWLLVRFWQSGRWWLWIPIVLITGVCVGIYEGIYPLILFAPLILVYLQGGITRRVIVTSLLWFITPFIFGLRVISILFLNNSSSTYQSSLFASDHSLGTILASIGRVNLYSLVESWGNAAWQTFTNGTWLGVRTAFTVFVNKPYFIDILAAAGIVAVTSIVLMRLPQNINISKKRLVLILLVSPIILSLGFLLYSLTELRNINVRTLLHASLGAAIFVSTFLWLVGTLLRRQATIYVIGLTILVVVATTSLLTQHKVHELAGERQVPFMQKLLRVMPEIAPTSTVVIIDETADREMAELFSISFYFDAPVKVIYGDATLSGVICYPNDPMGWGPYEEACRFQPDNFQLLLKDEPIWNREYNHLVIFRYSADKKLHLETDISQYVDSGQAVNLYTPVNLIDTNAALPIRAQTMLDMSP